MVGVSISIWAVEALSADEITRERLQKEKRWLTAEPWGRGRGRKGGLQRRLRHVQRGRRKPRQQRRAVFRGWGTTVSNAAEVKQAKLKNIP